MRLLHLLNCHVHVKWSTQPLHSNIDKNKPTWLLFTHIKYKYNLIIRVIWTKTNGKEFKKKKNEGKVSRMSTN